MSLLLFRAGMGNNYPAEFEADESLGTDESTQKV